MMSVISIMLVLHIMDDMVLCTEDLLQHIYYNKNSSIDIRKLVSTCEQK